MNVSPQSRLTPVRLVFRPDREGYIVEDVGTGEFYEMPRLCVLALEQLAAGKTIGAVEAELAARFPEEDVDMIGFAGQLLELGLVADLDGIAVKGANDGRIREAKPESGERHGRERIAKYALSPPMLAFYAAVVVANASLLVARPELLPRLSDAFPFASVALSSLTWLALSLVLIFLHELGHMTALRVHGLPARLGIGHRFVLVVVETEMSGVWRLDRKRRYAAFLAGIGVDQLVLLLALSVQAALPPETVGGVAGKLAALAVLDLTVKLAYQMCFFMKTDLYYVVEQATGCYNLMERSRDWLAGKLRGRDGEGSGKEREEPRAVRLYAAFYVFGYALQIGLIVFVFGPQLIAALSTAWRRLGESPAGAPFWDGVVFLAEFALFAGLLLRSWVRERREARAGRSA